MGDREEQLENMAQYQRFRYTIHWQGGMKDVLECMDIPEGWNILDMSDKAILCAANPFGVPLNATRNQEQARKMARLLRERKKKFNHVIRETLDQHTFQPTGEIARAFFVHQISEEEADEISNLLGAPFFLHFYHDPDLFISIVPSPSAKYGIKGLFFSFDR